MEAIRLVASDLNLGSLRGRFPWSALGSCDPELLDRVWHGERIGAEEGLALFSYPTWLLGQMAQRRRELATAKCFDGRGRVIVTYVVDLILNYTNICETGCRFCAFYRTDKQRDSYALTIPAVLEQVKRLREVGGTQVLLQGGHNARLSKEWYLELLTAMRRAAPEINIHGFSPSEVVFLSQQWRTSVRSILEDFKAAGLGSMPGGGAEILVDSVRRRIAPAKASAEEWLAVMRAAHDLGMRTTATMMFGHVESHADRVAHLMRLRELQDATRGFTAFIGWTFVPGNSRLSVDDAGSEEYLRTLAISRIVLDNFVNIQSSWVTQGFRVGQLALRFGANDMGGFMIEENVIRLAGRFFDMKRSDLVALIEDLGYEARERDTWYNLRGEDAFLSPLRHL